MIDDGMLERFPVKGAYAVHNWPGMPVGEFGSRPIWRSAERDTGARCPTSDILPSGSA